MHSVKKNYLLTTAYQLVYVLSPLLTTPYLSRILGSEGIGDYSFAYSVALYFTMFIRLGVMTYGNRAIAIVSGDRKGVSKTFCEIYLFQAICGIGFTGLYLLWLFLFAPNPYLMLSLVFFVLSAVIDITWLLYGVEDFTITSLRDIGVRIIIIICIFLFVKKADDLWLYALIQGAGYFAGQTLSWIKVKQYVTPVVPKWRDVLTHIKPDLILFIPTIAVSVYKTMDKIMLGIMASSKELGYYESSERVMNVPMAFILALGIVMLPRMSNLVANQTPETAINEIVNQSLVLATSVSSLLCFGLMSVADQFVPLFYGNGYEKCIEVYYWLLPSCVFLAFANVLRTQCLIPKKKDKHYIISLFSGAVINLVLNFMLIPPLASVGAAISTLTAECTVCVVQIAFIQKEQKLGKVILTVIPFIISGTGMFMLWKNRTIVMKGPVLSLVIKIVVCGVSYSLILGTIVCLKRFILSIKGKSEKE